MQLVDEHDDVRVLRELLHDRLQALFELTAIFRAGDDQRDVEREDALVREEVRHVAVDDLLREPLDDGRLSDTGLTNQHRVVLGAAAQHLLHAFELVVAADQRVELILHRRFRQIAAELGEQRRLLDARQRGLLVEKLDDVLADRVEAHPLLHQDGGGDAALLAQNPEQQMLGPDVVVQQPIRFLGRTPEHTLGFGAERNLDRGRHLFAEDRATLDFLADVFQGQMRARKNPARQPFTFPDQSKKEMLGLDRYAAELAGLIAGKEENSSRPFRVTFEHPARLGVKRLLTKTSLTSL